MSTKSANFCSFIAANDDAFDDNSREACLKVSMVRLSENSNMLLRSPYW